MPQPMGHKDDGQDNGIFVDVKKERTNIIEHVMDDVQDYGSFVSVEKERTNINEHVIYNSKLLDVPQQDPRQGKKLRTSQNSSAAANYCKLFNILGFFMLLMILMEHEHLPSI
jgi:hypothetical protein